MITYGRQSISEEDIEAVVKVLKGDWLTSGPAVTDFENVVREYVGAKHAIAVSNGTAALHLCCLALGIKKGDVGVTSPLTFLASANCIAFGGGRPDFIDVEEDTYCLSPEKLEEYIVKNGVPKVVIPVDYAGVPANLPHIWDLSKKYGFAVIEDAAHSIGSSYEHEGSVIHCGACEHSDFAIFSFHPVKTVTAGEGGMVLTNDDDLAKKIRMFASHGMEREISQFEPWSVSNENGNILHENYTDQDSNDIVPWLYQQQELGFNYRITDIQCALGKSQFARIDDIILRRREIFESYHKEFSNNKYIVCPPCPSGMEPAYHLYVVRYKGEDKSWRIKACSILRENNVFAQVHYIPVYLQPWYQKNFQYEKGKCPVSEEIYETCLSIPLYPTMKDTDVEKVIGIINGLT